MAKILTSVRVDREQLFQIKLRYGSLSSWVTKNMIREFGNTTVIENLASLVKTGVLTKKDIKNMLKDID